LEENQIEVDDQEQSKSYPSILAGLIRDTALGYYLWLLRREHLRHQIWLYFYTT